jgi:hypothetical protein
MCHMTARKRNESELTVVELVCSTNADQLYARALTSLPDGWQVYSIAPCLGALAAAVSSVELRRFADLGRS